MSKAQTLLADLWRFIKGFIGLPVVTRDESRRLKEHIEKERESAKR